MESGNKVQIMETVSEENTGNASKTVSSGTDKTTPAITKTSSALDLSKKIKMKPQIKKRSSEQIIIKKKDNEKKDVHFIKRTSEQDLMKKNEDEGKGKFSVVCLFKLPINFRKIIVLLKRKGKYQSMDNSKIGIRRGNCYRKNEEVSV